MELGLNTKTSITGRGDMYAEPSDIARMYADRWLALRPEVADFATLMESKLRENDFKGSWKGAPIRPLLDRIVEEYYELWEALSSGDIASVRRECADVANFCMMISDIVGGLGSRDVQASMLEEQ